MKIYTQGLGYKLNLRIVQFTNIDSYFIGELLTKIMQLLGYSLYYAGYKEYSFSKPIKI